MMRSVLVAGLAATGLMISACATTREEVPPRDDQRFACDATALQGMVGQVVSQRLGEEAVRTSHARTMRWIRPGEMVTMDYRTDRLNIHVDEQNRVVRVVCG